MQQRLEMLLWEAVVLMSKTQQGCSILKAQKTEKKNRPGTTMEAPTKKRKRCVGGEGVQRQKHSYVNFSEVEVQDARKRGVKRNMLSPLLQHKFGHLCID